MKEKLNRTKTIMFRLTEREYEILERAAKERGVTKSEVFRHLLFLIENPIKRGR